MGIWSGLHPACQGLLLVEGRGVLFKIQGIPHTWVVLYCTNQTVVVIVGISCGTPPAPTNGRIIGYSFAYQDNVTVQCGPGHYLHGSHMLTCKRDGSWAGNVEDSPICVGALLRRFDLVETTNMPSLLRRYVLCSALFLICDFWACVLAECPLNEYSANISSSAECLPCPDNSGTDATGSSDLQQCVCEEGFHRASGSTQCERE